MNQPATSIEQSRRIVELGVSPDTADMYYNSPVHFSPDELQCRFKGDDFVLGFDVPAWSLNQMMVLMAQQCQGLVDLRFPSSFNGKGEGFINKWCITYLTHDIQKVIYAYTPIDAATQMFEWLIINKLLIL